MSSGIYASKVKFCYLKLNETEENTLKLQTVGNKVVYTGGNSDWDSQLIFLYNHSKGVFKKVMLMINISWKQVLSNCFFTHQILSNCRLEENFDI